MQNFTDLVAQPTPAVKQERVSRKQQLDIDDLDEPSLQGDLVKTTPWFLLSLVKTNVLTAQFIRVQTLDNSTDILELELPVNFQHRLLSTDVRYLTGNDMLTFLREANAFSRLQTETAVSTIKLRKTAVLLAGAIGKAN